MKSSDVTSFDGGGLVGKALGSFQYLVSWIAEIGLIKFKIMPFFPDCRKYSSDRNYSKINQGIVESS